jgi:hypothetical protein
MKKLIFIIGLFTFGFVSSQEKKLEKPKAKNDIVKPHLKVDTAKSLELKNNPSDKFYKNVDSSKASKYKMLNKKPTEQYSELQQAKSQLYQIEKPKDSIKLKKKK